YSPLRSCDACVASSRGMGSLIAVLSDIDGTLSIQQSRERRFVAIEVKRSPRRLLTRLRRRRQYTTTGLEARATKGKAFYRSLPIERARSTWPTSKSQAPKLKQIPKSNQKIPNRV